MKKSTKHLTIAAVIALAFAAALGSFLLFSPGDRSGGGARDTVVPEASPIGQAEPLRDSSHRLTDPERSELTVVEFLDFECEACGAVYPAVEKLREKYGDRVTFVARYFPMPGHRNGELAALAAEAAARQDKFEAMYAKLFDTQQEWGEAQESKKDVFRGYARDIGLDMDEFDAALDDPEVIARVRYDQRDGHGLDVQGTPTFFVDGERIANPRSYEEFEALIEDRLSG
ncbi:DsbA family protein [Streptomyces zingiberis]|uniref:Thioredoxin domain-containing protein n=1 Tax=Streptomyces zingiberis TaxID=2053010 RepID=A0ABX1BY68_9ACTN|nr:thioredoxin domain-containing protein [Streptomyces zingiberis]NJQ01233.1 thioredoxin domain-containing protein [Streptomyces zingiberis]